MSNPLDVCKLVVEYDELLRHWGGPGQVLLEGDSAEIDAAYDKIVVAATAALVQRGSKMNPVLMELLDLLSAIPEYDRGISWELRDWNGNERLEVYGVVAKAFKYILDNTNDITAALSHNSAEAAWPNDPLAVAQLLDSAAANLRGGGHSPEERLEAAYRIAFKLSELAKVLYALPKPSISGEKE